MATDKNGIIIQRGNRVLIMGIVENSPEVGPLTVKIGNGEAFGANISVDKAHVTLRPEQPPAGFMEEQEAARKVAVEKGGQTSPYESIVGSLKKEISNLLEENLRLKEANDALTITAPANDPVETIVVDGKITRVGDVEVEFPAA